MPVVVLGEVDVNTLPSVKEGRFPDSINATGRVIYQNRNFLDLGGELGLFTSSGSGFFLRNLQHKGRGTASVQCVTAGGLNGESCEVKIHLLSASPGSFQSARIGFELLMAADSGTNGFLHWGIEPRINNGTFYQFRFRQSVGSGAVDMETGTDVYTNVLPAGGNSPVVSSAVQGAGDLWTHAKMIINTSTMTYESLFIDGVPITGVSGTPVVNRGAGNSSSELLFFFLGLNATAAVQNYYTAVWIITDESGTVG